MSARNRPQKAGASIGLEFDHLGIRAARLSLDGRGGGTVEKAVEILGDFAEDAKLLEGLRQLKEQLGGFGRSTVITCLSGKQVATTQIAFRRLPQEEMEGALRLELRKSTPFEMAAASLDYQILSEGVQGKAEGVQVLVAAASEGLVGRHLHLLEKAGIRVAVVDVLSVAVGNALWMWAGSSASGNPLVALHVGPQISTIVIDSIQSAFFHRNVYFQAEDVLAAHAGGERERAFMTLAEEVSRSLAYYESHAPASGFQEIHVMGDHAGSGELEQALKRKLGLPVRRMDLARRHAMPEPADAGRFDLAIALALRGDD